jgi:hypothetical protein
MSHFKSLTQMQVRLIHITIQVSPTGLERILQAWAGVPMYVLQLKYILQMKKEEAGRVLCILQLQMKKEEAGRVLFRPQNHKPNGLYVLQLKHMLKYILQMKKEQAGRLELDSILFTPRFPFPFPRLNHHLHG